MSGSGHVQDMNNRLNKTGHRPSNRPKFKTVSEEKLAKIKTRIRERSEKEQKKEWRVFIVFVIVGPIPVIAIFSLFN